MAMLKTHAWYSASQLFVVQHGATTFMAVVRKQQFSLLDRGYM